MSVARIRVRGCAPEFDAVRRFILDGSDFRSYLVIGTNDVKPTGELRTRRVRGAGEHFVEVVIFGIPFGITLQEIDMAVPPEEQLAVAGVVLIPLCGEPRPIGAVQP